MAERKRAFPGTGSVFQRGDGKWIAQLSSGPRTNRHVVKRVRDTEGQAWQALDELKDARKSGIRPSRLSLGDYLRSWLDESARPSVAPNTARGYEDAIRLWEPIWHIALAQLTAEDIEAVSNRMMSSKGNRKAPTLAPAAPKTVRNAQIMLRRALGQAELRGHVARNVARMVPLRRVPRRTHVALTPERAREILAAVAGDRYEAAYALALTGLRASEILGLSWDDYPKGQRVVHVRYQLVGSGERGALAQVKTPGSAAPVPLPGFVVDRVDAHRARQLEERVAAGMPTEDGLMFVTEAGLPVNGSWFGQHFQKLLAAASLPRLTVHQLRHGAATLLVGAGAHPRVAQELLRHASSRTTMEIYSHVTGAQQREAADMLDEAVAG